MNAITEFLITLFESFGLYSAQNGLGEHLRGLDLQCNDYSSQSIYSIVFICLFAINSILILNYYYGIFNRIPFNRWLWWFFNTMLGAFILFLIAFMYANNDLETRNYCNELKITTGDCYGFGFASAIFSILWSIIFSYIIKWKSTVNRTVNPFYFF